MSKHLMCALPSALFGLVLTACGGGGDSPPPVAQVHTANVAQAAGTAQSRLACYKGTALPECNLRMYQIMVEAFVDGDSAANYNTGYGTSHHKGDLQGIIDSLDYIKSTGVNAIWLTPIFESIAYGGQDDWTHRLDATGYYASNYFKVDPKFGTDAQFKTLVDEAHARGLYVFLDGVFGHYKDNIVASPTGKKPINRAQCLSADGQFSPGANQACADYAAPETLEFFQEVATYWIQNYKIDGWRLDQAYQVPADKWATLRTAVKNASAQVTYTNGQGATVNPLGYMVAEIWSGESTIASKGYGTTGTPALPSAFDFPVRYRVVQTLATEEWGMSNGNRNLPATTLASGFTNFSAYPDHAMPNLMLGNHDLVRFGDLIQRAGLNNPDQDGYWNRHKAAFAFMAAYSGPITLYYGDEIGQEVANYAQRVENDCAVQGLCDDHVARSSGKVSGLSARESDLKNYVAQLMQLREANPALVYGSRTHVYSDTNVYIDRKDAGANRVLLVLNAKPTKAIVNLKASAIGTPADLTDLISGATLAPATDTFEIEVPALSARFLKF